MKLAAFLLTLTWSLFLLPPDTLVADAADDAAGLRGARDSADDRSPPEPRKRRRRTKSGGEDRKERKKAETVENGNENVKELKPPVVKPDPQSDKRPKTDVQVRDEIEETGAVLDGGGAEQMAPSESEGRAEGAVDVVTVDVEGEEFEEEEEEQCQPGVGSIDSYAKGNNWPPVENFCVKNTDCASCCCFNHYEAHYFCVNKADETMLKGCTGNV